MGKKKTDKKLLILVIAIISFVSIVVATTYALLQMSSTGAANIIQVGEWLNLVLTNENTVNINTTIPMTDSYALSHEGEIPPYSFSLKNTGTNTVQYTITMEDIGITTLPSSVLRCAISADNGSTWSIAQDLSDFTYEGTISGNTTQNFKLKLWVNINMTNDYMNKTYSGRINVTATEATLQQVAIDLEEGMIPIKWDGDSWVKASSTNTNEDWYDYDTQKWANMALVTDTNRSTYQNATVNTEIPMNDILAMYVWIPRYRYQLWNTANGSKPEQEIMIEFEEVSTTKSIGDTNGEWLTHPAFTFGMDELNGIWVGKFETSIEETSTCYTSPSSANCNVSTLNPRIKPNVDSYRFVNVSNLYTTSQKFKTYGLTSTNTDSHMMKNMEWGAVAYLSHSRYGKYGNSSYTGANKEVYINNYRTDSASGYKTLTGCSAGSPSTGSSTTCSYTYEKIGTGTGASTTGTIYGIYDMSGGAYEYVMGNMVDSSGQFYPSSLGFATAPDSKYYDSYAYDASSSTTHNRGKLGDATKETLKTYGNTSGGWYSDYAYFPSSSNSWFRRGGYAGITSDAGVFNFYNSSGGAGNFSASRGVVVDVPD